MIWGVLGGSPGGPRGIPRESPEGFPGGPPKGPPQGDPPGGPPAGSLGGTPRISPHAPSRTGGPVTHLTASGRTGGPVTAVMQQHPPPTPGTPELSHTPLLSIVTLLDREIIIPRGCSWTLGFWDGCGATRALLCKQLRWSFSKWGFSGLPWGCLGAVCAAVWGAVSGVVVGPSGG